MNEQMLKSFKLVVLFGPPGVGKGTLADFCVAQMGFKTVSTGNVLREHIANGTALGLQVKAKIVAGQLVEDDLVNQMFETWLAEQDASVPLLLDGYPRTLEQAKFLLALLTKQGVEKTAAVFLMEADPEIIKMRILGRLMCVNKACGKIYTESALINKICPACGAVLTKRADDKSEVALRRLDDYLATKDQLLEVFKQANIKIIVSDTSTRTPEEVFGDFKEKVSCLMIV